MSTSRTREKADKVTFTQTEVTSAITAGDTAARAGRKNLIINGGMQVAQRATSVTGVGNGGNGFSTCDRWEYVESGTTGSVFTLTQSTDAPSGFGNSMKFDCTTAESTLAANEQLRLRYKFEGQDLQQLKKGTSEAESFTLSFWVKSHTTGAAAVCFYAANRQISALYTINSSATWEKKTITFSGDSTTAIPNDANDGFQLWFQLFAGSNNTSGTLPTSWTTYNENNNAVGQVLNIASSTDNYFQVTGVQLELGSVATDFEHRSYGEELALCQRYFYQHIKGAGFISLAMMYGATESYGYIDFPVTMRVPPTGSAVSGTNYYVCYTGGSGPNFNGITFSDTTTNTTRVQVELNTSATAGNAAMYQTGNANAGVSFDAEL